MVFRGGFLSGFLCLAASKRSISASCVTSVFSMEKNLVKGKAKENMDFQGYGLRDNPKKSWKSLGFADDGTTSSMLNFQCKACGKEFESMKALFGHMRRHSGRKSKGFNCQECGRKFQSLKALTGHMRLHPVKLRVSGESGSGGLRQDLVLESITVRRKRSKRMRYNNAPNSSLSSLNESSGLVEIDQEVRSEEHTSELQSLV